jgi:hypothetical protein
VKATQAPSLASRRTIAAPIPRDPPVIKATLSESIFGMYASPYSGTKSL